MPSIKNRAECLFFREHRKIGPFCSKMRSDARRERHFFKIFSGRTLRPPVQARALHEFASRHHPRACKESAIMGEKLVPLVRKCAQMRGESAIFFKIFWGRIPRPFVQASAFRASRCPASPATFSACPPEWLPPQPKQRRPLRLVYNTATPRPSPLDTAVTSGGE